MTKENAIGVETTVNADVKHEILQLSEIYSLETEYFKKTVDLLSLEHYIEYVFGEENFEIITGGVGEEDRLIDIVTKLQIPEIVVTSFKKCVAELPRKMVGLKLCFGPADVFPTLYVDLLEPWYVAFSFFETLPEIRDSLPILKQRLEESKVCMSLAFSLDKLTNKLLVKTYYPCDRTKKTPHNPLMISLRLSDGLVYQQPKFYRSLSREEIVHVNEKLAHITDRSAEIFSRKYRSVCGYNFENNEVKNLKIYVLRKDSRFNAWVPRNDSIYTTEGNILLRLKRFDDAIHSYTNAIDYYEKDFTAYTNRALCYALIGKHDLAVEDAWNAKALEPNMNFKQSDAYFNFIKDISRISKQLNSAPTAQLYNELGILLFSRGLFLEAKKNFELALKLDSGFAEAYNNLGGACINLGLFSEAFDYCGKAISLDDRTDTTNYIIALNGMGRTKV
ncbi:MAG: tetratricopeptide repeat protein [Hormoscilla sp. GUM202]|nr:tetratricopeptide repeat protein [Hormoscilla sp. GUM202]